jgi:hypothetical protein
MVGATFRQRANHMKRETVDRISEVADYFFEGAFIAFVGSISLLLYLTTIGAV